MEVVSKVTDIRKRLDAVRKKRTIGFVPTMGALHEGHLALIRRARNDNDYVVVSIFVNPLQFGPGEDFDKYPRTPKSDARKLKSAGVDMLFCPAGSEIYPSGTSTAVDEKKFSAGLCGDARPGHFMGVATVVCKLLNIVEPARAYFGRKDYQQLKVIDQMVRDLFMRVSIVPCPIVRHKNGLALSSRNKYLSEVEFEESAEIYGALLCAAELVKSNPGVSVNKVYSTVKRMINKIAVKHRIDYIEILDADSFEAIDHFHGKVLIAVAVFIGQTRLIDNILIRVARSRLL